ncbi:hypothetical protein Q2K19_11420 [Micromonospora soli]|uniref:hypothetical protein n=1 Tax=Micromonospora sp. NBRC 110009 TaxID=3061627 RepID=UPI002671A4C8|nr:hypothetical protein [Micromonospora sp. NBRC 110009]WKU01032.1 hypothetical protein Q2K19_11420 [Micromonospora sp. NBRC 110009]
MGSWSRFASSPRAGRSRWLRILASAGALAVAMTAGGAAVSTPQVAKAAGCKADTCEGKWAGEQGCTADQVLVDDRNQHIYVTTRDDAATRLIEGQGKLYYSPTCQSTWVDYQITYQSPDTSWEANFQFWELTQYGANEMRKPLAESPLFPGTYVNFTTAGVDLWRSAMTNWNNSVMACWYVGEDEPTPNNDPYGELEDQCTPWN